MESVTLVEFLVWLATGGGAGLFSYWFWGRLEAWSKKVDNLSKELKGYLTIALTILVSCGAGYGLTLLGVESVPPTLQGWVEYLFSVGGTAVSLSKVIHAARQLRYQE